MATTTNYGWTTPDDTDLVKDGAAAIRTLGSSVDTTTKALNPETTTGDIAYRSATANTNTRLALGTAGQVLTVNSGATAPEWASAASGGMTVLASGSLSGASTNISSISQAYQSLKLVLTEWYASSVDATMSFNSDTSSNYQQALVKSADNTVSTSGGSATKMYLHNQSGSTSDATAVAVLDVDDYTEAGAGKIWRLNNYYVANNNSTKVFEMQAGCFVSNTAITSIQVTTPGTWSGGLYVLYGVK